MVDCPCGHPMGSHDAFGCAGDRRRRCACDRDPERVLDAAIDRERARQWASYSAQHSDL